jgi:hypothetical protein
MKPLVKLLIAYEDPELPGFGGETVWAKPLGGKRYQIQNEPLFEDLSWGDVVIAEPKRGMLTFKRLVPKRK